MRGHALHLAIIQVSIQTPIVTLKTLFPIKFTLYHQGHFHKCWNLIIFPTALLWAEESLENLYKSLQNMEQIISGKYREHGNRLCNHPTVLSDCFIECTAWLHSLSLYWGWRQPSLSMQGCLQTLIPPCPPQSLFSPPWNWGSRRPEFSVSL